MTRPPFDGREATATIPGVEKVPEPAANAPAQPAEGSETFPGSFGARAPLAAGDLAAASPPPARVPSAFQAPAGAAAAAEPESLNLARRPFVNTRPVARVAAILWVLGALLLAANVALFRGYLTKSQVSRIKLAGLERNIAREKHAGADLQSRLGSLSLEQQNREVTFLNRKIDERTFSWSLLFERMAEVLPKEVRLLRLRPTNVVQRDVGQPARASAREPSAPPVTLTLHGEAKSDEALLRFVDNMFAHPAFAEPNLLGEEREDSGLVKFDVVVQYQPNAQAARSSAPPAGPPGPAPVDLRPPPGAPPAAARPLSPAGAGLIRLAPPPAPRRPPAARTGSAAARRPGPTGGRR
jgi:Tfp pilus assembly protein PilN